MKTISILTTTALLSAVAASAQTSADPSRETVSLVRASTPTKINAGTTFAVAVYATSQTPGQFSLYGYQFDLKFDPTHLQATGVSEGSSFQTTQFSDFLAGAIDNTAGTIHTSYDTLQGGTAAVRDQNAQMAVIQFKALQTGNADIALLSPVLVDQTGKKVLLNPTSGIHVLVEDSTPPVVTPRISGSLGTNGWYTSTVNVAWTETDGESGISSPPCPTTTITADTSAQAVSCTATNGAGLFTTQTVTIKKDSTAPVPKATVSGTLGTNGWYTSNVAVNWTVAAGPSGNTSQPCPNATVTADTAGVTYTCQATSGAGLTGTQTVAVKRDATPPVISGLPAPGSCSVWPPDKKMVTVATVTAADPNGSGLLAGSLTVIGASNEPQSPNDPDIVILGGVIQVRADRLGKGNGRIYTFTATASDLAGNTATASGQCVVPH